jgi:hypothetical protein
LERLTVACVDTVSPAFGFRALQRTLDLMEGAKGLFISNNFDGLNDRRVAFHRIAAFPDVTAYSEFILTKLARYLTTSHVLLVQWDGFAINRSAWDEGFLEYDYVGAPWPQFAPPCNVGNGGFSIRSRQLLDAILDTEILLHAPEDVCICRTNRQVLETRHGIKFAPESVAARFAFERTIPVEPTFGFHGLFNFPAALPEFYRQELGSLPNSLLKNRDAIDLAHQLKSSSDPLDRSLALKILLNIGLSQPWRMPQIIRAWVT